MFDRILSILSRSVPNQNWRNLARILDANAVNNAASLALLVVAARVLGPGDFGKLGVAVTVTVMLGLAFDGGISLSYVRHHAQHVGEHDHDLPRLGTVVVRWKFMVLAAALVFSPILATGITLLVPNLQAAGPLPILVVISGALEGLWKTIRSLDQAKQDFISFRKHTYVYAISRVIGLAFCLLFSRSIIGFFVALYLAPQLGAALIVFSGQQKAIAAGVAKPSATTAGLKLTILRYGLWVALSTFLYAALLRFPQLALVHYASETDVGMFTAGLTFLAVFSLGNEALRTLLLPDVSARQDQAARLRFYERLKSKAPAYFATAFLLLIGLATGQYLLLGENYRESIPIFLTIGTGMIVTIYLGTFNTLIHSFGVPRLDVAANTGRLGILTILLAWIQPEPLFAALILGLVMVTGETGVFLTMRKRVLAKRE
jgi:O-antigen/teichoic acid export membrane protein